jgi:hypothetical protein
MSRDFLNPGTYQELEKCSDLSATRKGPSYSGNSSGWAPSWWTNTNRDSKKHSGNSSGSGVV